MKQFKFKLETVLKLRQRVEEERRQQLQQAERRQYAAQVEVERIQAEMDQTRDDYQQSIRQKFDRYRANDYYQYLSWLGEKRGVAEAELERCRAGVAAARQALLAAARERRILDKLKDKAYEEYQGEQRRVEAEFLDELGTGRFARKDNTEQGG